MTNFRIYIILKYKDQENSSAWDMLFIKIINETWPVNFTGLNHGSNKFYCGNNDGTGYFCWSAFAQDMPQTIIKKFTGIKSFS